MKDTFTIRLTGDINGEEIHPSTFDVKELNKLIAGLINAIRIEAATEYGNSVRAIRLLSLNSIEDKCSAFNFNCTEMAQPASQRVESAVCTGNFDTLEDESQDEIRKVFSPLIAKGACIQWIGEETSPVYSKEHPLPNEKKIGIFVEQQASLLVKVLKIGGVSHPSVKAIFDTTGQELQAACDTKTCKRLSDEKCLYESVTLIGVAKWHRDTWKLKSFQVKDFIKHYQGTGKEFLDSLDPRFAEACNAIDIDTHLSDLRDEG